MGIPRYETRKVVLAKFKTCLVRSAAAKIVDLREDFMGPTHRQFKCGQYMCPADPSPFLADADLTTDNFVSTDQPLTIHSTLSQAVLEAVRMRPPLCCDGLRGPPTSLGNRDLRDRLYYYSVGLPQGTGALSQTAHSLTPMTRASVWRLPVLWPYG